MFDKQDRKPSTTSESPAADNVTAGEQHAQQCFSSEGPLPEVMSPAMEDSAPSASQLAFDGPSKMRVTASTLNVRTSPSKASHKNIIDKLHSNTVVEAVGHDGDWVRVDHHGQNAFVHGHYVETVKAGQPDTRALKVAEHHVVPAISNTPSEAPPEIAPPTKITPPATEQPSNASAAKDSPAPAVSAPPVEHHEVVQPPAPTTTPAAPKIDPPPQHTVLHSKAEQVHQDVAEGKLPQHQAVQEVVAADQQLNAHTKEPVSDLGMEVVGSLLEAFATETHSAAPVETTLKTEPQKTEPTKQPAPEPVKPKPAAKGGKAYLAKYTSLGGTQMDQLQTSKGEATILNELRASSERFDPAWLVKAQKTLGVVETGSMNTETLRAMRKQRPDLDAAKIVANDGGYLTTLAAGLPFIHTNDGFGEGSEKDRKAAKGKTKADRASRRLGYDDYAAYYDTLQPQVKFLGADLDGGLLHPHFVERLAVAEKWIRQRHPEAKTDKELQQAVQWSGVANGSYEASTKYGTSHFHTMGMAIDIDKSHNPYVFTGRKGEVKEKDTDAVKAEKTGADWWMSVWEKHTKYAAKIYGGEGVSADTMNSWSKTMSTDELWAHIHQTSDSWRQYLVLAGDAAKSKAQYAAHNLPEADLPEMAKIPGYWHNNMSRGAANQLTNVSQELLIALRDVAGLSWGGAEMSGNENGDFMHFDTRHDSFGSKLFDFNNGK